MTQSNDASASAAAGVDGAAAGTGTAAATADQPSPTNVNVSVHIASPGSGGDVSQTNNATADASNAPEAASASTPPAPADAQADISNTSDVDQSLGECANACATPASGAGSAQPSPFETVTASPAAAGSQTATAAQSNPTNVNISVRVGSPGHDDVPTQVNTADANAASASVTTSGERNVNVFVVLPGGDIVYPRAAPVGLDPGVDRRHDADACRCADWIERVGLVVARDAGLGGSDRRREPDGLGLAGRRALDLDLDVDRVQRHHELVQLRPGVLVQLGVGLDVEWRPVAGGKQPRRRFAGEPARAAASPAVDAAPAQDTPDITQTNSSAATATAIASFTQAQSAGDEPAGVVQVVSNSQRADAAAEAVQIRPTNVNVITAGVLDGLIQENTAEATASATVDLAVSQTATRTKDEAAAGAPASSTQTVTSSQSAIADARAVQVDATNVNTVSSPAPSTAEIGRVEQQNTAGAEASAASTGSVAQNVSQSQTGEGPQEASASQTSASTQAATASAQASQTRVGNLNDVVIPVLGVSNPALAQSNSLAVDAGGRVHELRPADDEPGFVQQRHDGAAEPRGRSGGGREAVRRRRGRPGAGRPAERLLLGRDRLRPRRRPSRRRQQQHRWESQRAVCRSRLRARSHSGSSGRHPCARGSRAAGPPSAGHPTPATPSRPQPLHTAPATLVPTFAGGALLAQTPPALVERRATAKRAKAGRSNGRSPVCTSCGSSSVLGVIVSAHGTGSAGVAATLSRFLVFAPSGAGRVRAEAPALGLPVDTAALERPG